MKATIRLFKALPVKTRRTKKVAKYIMEKTIPMGFVFSPVVAYNYSENELEKIILDIREVVGLTAAEMNASFHKSWKKVATASIEQLVMEQVVHYFTTYGFEALGVYNEESVYIPKEKLEIPDLDIKGLSLTVINGLTKAELKEKVMHLFSSGIALKEETMMDMMDVYKFVGIDIEKDIKVVKNKEIKIMLYGEFGIVPENPVEFLRYILYLTTKKTLLIKDKKTIEEIKKSGYKAIGLFNKYGQRHGLKKLAQIFYRFKPLFLAFRADASLHHTINRIRKLAKLHHKPMQESYLNTVTALIKNRIAIHYGDMKKELSKANIFRKIRLAYALKFRTQDVEAILYRIRNGKGYVEDFDFKRKEEAKNVLEFVLLSIVEDLRKNVKGKKIYIPQHMVYALPATEKQFTGDFPSGTYVKVPRDMIAGVHWKNSKKWGRVDLDMSMISSEGKIGWDAYYRSTGNDVLFSGDLTDAPSPNGASELFYIKRQTASNHIVMINYYNYSKGASVDHDIVVAAGLVRSFDRDYMLDPNLVLARAKTKIDQKQKILGLMTVNTKGSRFYFAECYLGNTISARGKNLDLARSWLFSFYKNSISLNDLLERAGAKIVDKPEKCDIDLSPEKLEKGKIIQLLQ